MRNLFGCGCSGSTVPISISGGSVGRLRLAKSVREMRLLWRPQGSPAGLQKSSQWTVTCRKPLRVRLSRWHLRTKSTSAGVICSQRLMHDQNTVTVMQLNLYGFMSGLYSRGTPIYLKPVRRQRPPKLNCYSTRSMSTRFNRKQAPCWSWMR